MLSDHSQGLRRLVAWWTTGLGTLFQLDAFHGDDDLDVGALHVQKRRAEHERPAWSVTSALITAMNSLASSM